MCDIWIPARKKLRLKAERFSGLPILKSNSRRICFSSMERLPWTVTDRSMDLAPSWILKTISTPLSFRVLKNSSTSTSRKPCEDVIVSYAESIQFQRSAIELHRIPEYWFFQFEHFFQIVSWQCLIPFKLDSPHNIFYSGDLTVKRNECHSGKCQCRQRRSDFGNQSRTGTCADIWGGPDRLHRTSP